MIPEFLNNLLNTYYSADLVSKIIDGYQKKYVSLRINTLKTTYEEVINILDNNQILYEQVPWYNNALIITNVNEDIIRSLTIYNEGKIYLQSLSSMLPPLYLNPKENELILDMAAAPGGKTTEIATITNNKAMITAIEKNKIRAEKLKYNLELQGAKKVSVLTIDSRNLDEYFMFDKILLDAPCSGSGTLITNNINEKYFNLDLINNSSKTQISLLEEAIKHLKVNGELIYSTCSILKSENEEVINYILNKYPNLQLVKLNLINDSSIPLLPSTLNEVITIMPTKYYEGFFIAKLVKTK